MKINIFMLAIAAAAGIPLLVGCQQETANNSTPATGPPPATVDGGEHEHAEEGETDHSVAGHAHGAGPHDGTIADWGGGKYHVEFTVSHEDQQATVYILGSDEKSPSPIVAEEVTLTIVDPEMQVTLEPAPQEGDPQGKASRFVGTHESLGVVQEYAGTITGVIDGTPYSGDFEEVAHDHE